MDGAQIHPSQVALNQAREEEARAATDQARAEARLAAVQASEAERLQSVQRASEFENRIYTFNHPIMGATVEDCVGTIGIWARRSGAPIEIVFNSPGGGVFDGLALFDYIAKLRDGGVPVNTHALGKALSMGAVILQAGGERTMSRHCYLMMHEVSGVAEGATSGMRDAATFQERLEGDLLEILAERSTMSEDEIADRWARRDWWLDADEALRLGFCDAVT